MNFKKLTFENSRGQKLAARLDLPDSGAPSAYALFAHCFTCTKNLKAIGNITGPLTRQGLGVLRFDFTGLGQSEGDFSDTNFSTNVADLVAAARYLTTHHDAPKLLIGHSLGGAAVIKAAADIPDARAVAVIAAPAETDHVLKHMEDTREKIESQGESMVTLAGRPFRIKKQFLADIEATKLADAIGNLRRALLVLHSPVDDIVDIENAARIFKTARHPKSFVSLDTADHLLSRAADSQYAGAVIAAWAGKYLSPTSGTPM